MFYIVCGDTFSYCHFQLWSYSFFTIPIPCHSQFLIVTLFLYMFLSLLFLLSPIFLSFHHIFFLTSLFVRLFVCAREHSLCVCVFGPKREIIRPSDYKMSVVQHKIDGNYCKHFAGKTRKNGKYHKFIWHWKEYRPKNVFSLPPSPERFFTTFLFFHLKFEIF